MKRPSVPKWLTDYVVATNSHDPAAVVALMSADVVVIDTAFGGTFTGRAQVAALIAGMGEGLSSDYRFDVRTVVESGDHYAFEWVLSGTHDRNNPALGLAPTGKRFAVPGLTIGLRRGGLIAENRDYWNLAGLLTQLGQTPRRASTETAGPNEAPARTTPHRYER